MKIVNAVLIGAASLFSSYVATERLLWQIQTG